MTDFGIWTKNADIQARAGINADTVAKSLTETDKYVLQSESIVNVATRFNWSDAYAGLNDDVKQILKAATTAWCAIEVIRNNMSGFTSRGEAESMMAFLRDDMQRNLGILRDKKFQKFILEAGA